MTAAAPALPGAPAPRSTRRRGAAAAQPAAAPAGTPGVISGNIPFSVEVEPINMRVAAQLVNAGQPVGQQVAPGAAAAQPAAQQRNAFNGQLFAAIGLGLLLLTGIALYCLGDRKTGVAQQPVAPGSVVTTQPPVVAGPPASPVAPVVTTPPAAPVVVPAPPVTQTVDVNVNVNGQPVHTQTSRQTTPPAAAPAARTPAPAASAASGKPGIFWGWVHPNSSATDKKPCYADRPIQGMPDRCSQVIVEPHNKGETEDAWRTRMAAKVGLKNVINSDVKVN